MKILAYDTSSKYLSVAVAKDGEILSNFHEDKGMSHSSLLIPTIDSVLKKANLKLKDIDVIALSIGPGSFTGLRIGVSTVKAISLALKIPAIGVPSLDVIAYTYVKYTDDHRLRHADDRRLEDTDDHRLKTDDHRYLAPILDAKKNKVYSAIYDISQGSVNRKTDYLLLDIDTLLAKIDQPTLFFGDGLNLYGKYIEEKSPFVKISKSQDWYPRAETVALLAFEKAKKRQFDDIDSLVPMYLHPKECNIKRFEERVK